MRAYKSNAKIAVNAVAGNNVVLLGMDATEEARKGLLGFAIQRTDHTSGGEERWLRSSLSFDHHPTHKAGDESLDSISHPIQDFKWGDYAAKPDHEYTYKVIPIYGSPTDLVQGDAVSVKVKTESISNETDAVFFNRGAAASQAYVERFGNKRPDEVEGDEAWKWLSRGLEEALIGFIGQAEGAGWSLRACLYEFNHHPVLEAFKAAAGRGADVKIVFDHKKAEGDPGKGNLEAIKAVGIEDLVIPREANKSAISHNKFILLLKGDEPVQVWTGSTNITRGAIFGHSNVGHQIRDKGLAAAYLTYWNKIVTDPTGKTFRPFNDEIFPVKADDPPYQPIFSPRGSLEALETYARMMDDSQGAVFMTAAFGVSDELKDVLVQEKPYLRYLLMDNPGQKSNQDNYEAIKKLPGNRIAMGDTIRQDNELDHWHKESLTGLNTNVKYVHTKYMIIDPFGERPVLIGGSANFSAASTTKNDENMVIVRNNPCVVDIYVGEFMRLFSHFYFRNWLNAKYKKEGKEVEIHLTPNDSWTDQYYVAGSERAKERMLFVGKPVADEGKADAS